MATAGGHPDSVARAVLLALARLDPGGFVPTDDHPSGSPFATAWCLRLLALGREDTSVSRKIARAAHWLGEQQQADGSWAASARLRVPYPHDTDPDRFEGWVVDGTIEGSLSFDRERIFTTATVLQALHRSRPENRDG